MVWRIPPLRVATTAPGYSDAVALLVDRAAAARGGRPADSAEIGDLTRVATALDGLPLALELAAARLRILTADQLAERIDDVLGTLDAGDRAGADPGGTVTAPADRHLTMQAAIAWSGGVTTNLKSDVQAKSLIGMGSGESFQLGFSGQGWVLIQPSEGRPVPTS